MIPMTEFCQHLVFLAAVRFCEISTEPVRLYVIQSFLKTTSWSTPMDLPVLISFLLTTL